MGNKSNTSLFSRFMGNVYGGLFLMLPLAIVVIVALKIYALLISPVREFAAKVGIERPYLIQLLLITMVLILCFFAGLLMHARSVKRFRDYLEGSILRMIPGYEFVRMRLSMMVGAKNTTVEEKAILVRFDDGWSPALLVEDDGNGYCTVFVPDVPKANSGSIIIVTSDRVKILPVSFKELDISIRNYGKGLSKTYTDLQ